MCMTLFHMIGLTHLFCLSLLLHFLLFRLSQSKPVFGDGLITFLSLCLHKKNSGAGKEAPQGMHEKDHTLYYVLLTLASQTINFETSCTIFRAPSSFSYTSFPPSSSHFRSRSAEAWFRVWIKASRLLISLWSLILLSKRSVTCSCVVVEEVSCTLIRAKSSCACCACTGGVCAMPTRWSPSLRLCIVRAERLGERSEPLPDPPAC